MDSQNEIVYKLNDFRYSDDNLTPFFKRMYDIFDALPNNVLHGIDNQIYFIDTIIYPTAADNFDTYKSLSPRYTK